MELRLFADGVDNPGNRRRIADAARLLGGVEVADAQAPVIAVENAPTAQPVYGRRAHRGAATLALGNERRGLSRALLAAADETLEIPTLSRTVTTLNVAAAAAVAGWYVARGSGPQARASHPERRRPTVLLSGDDHVEVGSSLRSAAAFGFREVYLEDRDAGWFEGDHHRRREARAAARRHKNAIRVRRATDDLVQRFDSVAFVSATGPGAPIGRQRLARGHRQLVVVGVEPDAAAVSSAADARIVSLGLEDGPAPLRLVASIVLAEIARQVGRPATVRAPRPPTRGPRYERELGLVADGEMLFVEHASLLDY